MPRPIETSLSATPAIATLKKNLIHEGTPYVAEDNGVDLLRRAFADKGFSPQATQGLAQTRDSALGRLVSSLILKEERLKPSFYIDRAFIDSPQDESVTPQYRGTTEENVVIDSSIKNSKNKRSEKRQKTGAGAARLLDNLTFVPSNIDRTPIVIIGGGPAGIITARSLLAMGILNVTILDKTGKFNGIWNQKNVGGKEVSKNNPFQIDMRVVGDVTLKPAPGPGSDVPEFLKEVAESEALGSYSLHEEYNLQQATVTQIEPGDLEHVIHVRRPDGSTDTITAPIVINTIGTGKPLPASRDGHMTTDTPEKAGVRWQQVLTPEKAEKYRNKTMVFIGLGNSTAEMIIQVKKLNQQGFNIDYRILTHYPEEAIEKPDETAMQEGKEYRVFRDLSKPNLVRWEGDLPEARDAYMEALDNNKIIADVKHWDKEGETLTITKSDDSQETVPCDQLYTLIGYGHDKDTLEAMGMTVTDDYLGIIATDYDGEIQRTPGATGRERVYPGYFANGALLKSPSNPNATVIPGMMFRTPDLLFSVVVRATEAFLKEHPEVDLDDRFYMLRTNET